MAKGNQKREVRLTEEQITIQCIAQAINQWLHRKDVDVVKYVNFVDRVCEIAEVVREALPRAQEIISKGYAENDPRMVKGGRVTMALVLVGKQKEEADAAPI